MLVDNYSEYTYIHLMTKMNTPSTVKVKEAFEHIARSYNVTINNYHCNNGLFDTKYFKSSIQKANQSITFCVVNTHHQNGKAERRIKDVIEGAITDLLHLPHCCPKAINPFL